MISICSVKVNLAALFTSLKKLKNTVFSSFMIK